MWIYTSSHQLKKMTKHSEILDNEWRDSSKLKKGLNKLRINIFFVPVFFSIAYLIVRITKVFEWESGMWLIIGFWIGTILGVVFKELKPKYIYDFSINEEAIRFYLVNVFGNKEDVFLQMSQIEKIKYRKKNFWRNWDKVWVHLDDSVKELYFIKKGLGNGLIENLKVEKI